MSHHHFQFSFSVAKSPDQLYPELLNPKFWWIGLYGEDIQGQSQFIGDEFTFRAGNGVHYSKQKLVESTPGKKILWQVTDSHLTFLEAKDEWTGSQFGFDLQEENGKTTVTFSHHGLTPEIECFDQCSSAWTQYLQNLVQHYHRLDLNS